MQFSELSPVLQALLATIFTWFMTGGGRFLRLLHERP